MKKGEIPLTLIVILILLVILFVTGFIFAKKIYGVFG